jgi:PAS domain S-box-containing protein
MDDCFKKYFDIMPCYVTVQNRDFRIINANDRFINEFGKTDGRLCYQVYKQRPEKCEDCPVDRTFRDGHPHRSEEIVRTLDGRDVHVIVYTTPVKNDSGEIVAVMEMSTDITDIKLLQRQLKESQERYRILFEEVPCFISIQDENLRIVDFNRLHRETFNTRYGDRCYKVYKQREKECEPCLVRQTFQDGQVRMHEETVKSQTGELLNVLVCTAPVTDADGKISRVIEMSTDITQIRQLQDKLSSVGLLIGSISHGIKGLLNGLDGGIYLVNSGLKKNDRERIDRGWDIAMRNVRRIRSMVMDILYYAKDREPDWQKVAAEEVMNDVCRMMEERAKKLNIEFEYSGGDGIGEFEADPQAVRSLLVNLVENALDACRIDKKKQHHHVSVMVEGVPEAVKFAVTDNGVGMDRETCDKAFTLFFSSKGAGGTGLGLFIANKITQAHGGEIELESEESNGSRLVVTLPRKRPAEKLTIEND